MLADMWMAASTERLSNRHRLTCALNADSICSHHPHIYIPFFPLYSFSCFSIWKERNNEYMFASSLVTKWTWRRTLLHLEAANQVYNARSNLNRNLLCTDWQWLLLDRPVLWLKKEEMDILLDISSYSLMNKITEISSFKCLPNGNNQF